MYNYLLFCGCSAMLSLIPVDEQCDTCELPVECRRITTYAEETGRFIAMGLAPDEEPSGG